MPIPQERKHQWVFSLEELYDMLGSRRKHPDVVVMCELGALRSQDTARMLRYIGVDAVAMSGGVARLANAPILRFTYRPLSDEAREKAIGRIARANVALVLNDGEYYQYRPTITALRQGVEHRGGNFLFASPVELAVHKIRQWFGS